MTFEGYHGTDSTRINPIIKDGFYPSEGEDEWLGFGVYFFIGDTFCPITNAKEWSISRAWDNNLKRPKYTKYGILKALVTGDKVLDLRLNEDLKILNKLRTKIMNKYHENKRFFQPNQHFAPDTYLMNAVTELLETDIIINNFYIKTADQIKNKEHSRIPNSTVLCAKKTADIKDIKSFRTGDFHVKTRMVR